MSHFKQSGRRGSLLLEGKSAFLFHVGLKLIGYRTPALEKAIFFFFTVLLSIPIQILPSFINALPDTLRIVFDLISGHPLGESC